jgi:hypothetical protein
MVIFQFACKLLPEGNIMVNPVDTVEKLQIIDGLWWKHHLEHMELFSILVGTPRNKKKNQTF